MEPVDLPGGPTPQLAAVAGARPWSASSPPFLSRSAAGHAKKHAKKILDPGSATATVGAAPPAGNHTIVGRRRHRLADRVLRHQTTVKAATAKLFFGMKRVRAAHVGPT